MITLRVFESHSFDPRVNLAIEEWLLDHTPRAEIWLYLWQNEHTIVLGKNQNAWFECNLKAFEEDGGSLVRRLSGGGCVYHDLGNLNFTFFACENHYDTARQTVVLKRALRSFGIEAEVSGRNDVLVDGCKVSGNAYCQRGPKHYHHGTLLVDCDFSKMAAYLTPHRKKLEAKGVSSVASRVLNLKEAAPDLTIPALKEALAKAFEEEYSGEALHQKGDVRDVFPIPEDELSPLIKKYASEEWTLRSPEPFTWLSDVVRLSEDPCFGLFQLGLSAREGRISKAVLYTDSLDETCSLRTEQALLSQPFDRDTIKQALHQAGLAPLTSLLASFP